MSESNEERINELDQVTDAMARKAVAAAEREAVSAAAQAAGDDQSFQAAVAAQRSDAKPLFERNPASDNTRAPEPAERLMRYFDYSSDPDEPITQLYYQLAKKIVDTQPAGPERTVGLRALLDSRTAILRNALP